MRNTQRQTADKSAFVGSLLSVSAGGSLTPAKSDRLNLRR